MNIKQTINIISKNKDARTVLTNFSWLAALQVAGYVFPLLTMPYLAKTIGAVGFGKIAFAAAIISWIQTIADWGFNFTATRDVARNRDNKVAVSKIFSNVLWAKCILMIASFIVLITLISVIPEFKRNYAVILTTFLIVPGQICFPDWYFQAIEKMKYITIFNFLIKLLFTGAVFLFIKNADDYILQPLFTSLGFIISGALALYVIIIKWGIKIYSPDLHAIYDTIKNSTDVFVNNLTPNLYNSFSIVLLGIYGDSRANGLFDGGNKFITICNQFLSIISRAFYPFLSRDISKHKVFVIISLVLSTILALILFAFAPIIISIMLSPEFTDSVIVLRILSPSLIFLALSNAYGTNYLIIKGREHELRNITIFSSIIGFIIAWPLIHTYTYLGAAITILSSRILLGTLSYIKAKHY